ncbi:putative efflux protein, MATE family [Pseudobutyrivibrio sp. 49]|uniref:MATE family efflux transporter n=1 Tax=unclassified Pseudobutyrivibrio TaxID=2638619 RepID=UPI000890644C|nr:MULTISPECIES: MATE family efflux transporter [unclassified Pseudobutyrivibrio]SDH79648.1 putative efflux protein, MATE family [Pseudobutyrivibrio sp. 49]SFO01996.1 putative efflux protein, MATE family [Pseudobutyrivibrio sp. UC1225]
MKDRLFADKDFLRRLFNLTLPIAFQALMLALVAACDAVMLGRIEQNSMAAVSLATQVQFIQNMMLCAVTGSISILGAQYWGKGDKKTLHKIFGMSLRIAFVISLLFCVACVVFPRQLMMIFASDEALISIGACYLRIAGWSYLLTGFSQCFLGMMRVTEHADRCAIISSGAVVINIILNGILIFGLMGLPALGAEGAAIATLISRIIELVWAVISSFQKDFIHPSLKDLVVRDALLLKDYVRCGLPLAGAAMFWGVGFTSYTAFMGHLGTDSAAANSVAAVVRDLMCCVCDGVSAAGGIIIGNELGAGNLERGKLYGQRISKMSVLIGFFSTVIILLVTPLVVNFIILTPQAKQYLIGMMVIMAFYMIGRCINTVVINGVFGAGGDTLFDIYSLAVCMWCIAVPIAFLGAFVFHWPVLAVYACTCLDEVGKLPWVFYHYKKYKWVKDLTR